MIITMSALTFAMCYTIIPSLLLMVRSGFGPSDMDVMSMATILMKMVLIMWLWLL